MSLATLLAAFIIMPILELTVLFKVHESVGMGNTLALVIFTGVTGAFLAKAQGIVVMARIRRDLAEGRMPAPQLMDGMMILIAGVLLITPGLITDIAGFLLLAPAVRAAVRAWLRRKMEEKLQNGSMRTTIWRS